MRAFRTCVLPCSGLSAIVVLAATIAIAHPTPETGPGPAHHGHGHDHEHEQERPEPTAEQKKKRLERVIQRGRESANTREQRREDRRRALKKRLARRLDNAKVSDAVRAELVQHARRVAGLRQIRLVAAENDDFDSVAAVDRILARENARHERWWRERPAGERP